MTFKSFLQIDDNTSDAEVFSLYFDIPLAEVNDMPYTEFLSKFKTIDFSIPKPAPFTFNGETFTPVTHFSDIKTGQWLTIQGNQPSLEGIALALFGQDVYDMDFRVVVSHVRSFVLALTNWLRDTIQYSKSIVKAHQMVTKMKIRMQGTAQH